MDFFEQYHIIILGSCFLSILVGMTWLTSKDKKWVREHYKKEDIIALGFGVTCFGVSSDQGAPKKHKGFLLVHRGGLLFKSRFFGNGFSRNMKAGTIFSINRESIQKVYHADSHKGARLYQSAVKIDFLTSVNITDTIAFKVAYPSQWIKIIEKILL